MGQKLLREAIQLKFTPTKAVAAALERLGRTEDVHFSPDGKRLAVAGYNNSRLLILDIKFENESKASSLVASDYLEITSASLKLPHGLFWINDFTIIVANRFGAVVIFQLPIEKPAERLLNLAPVLTLGKAAFSKIKNPGSVSVAELGKNQFEILLCNNFSNMVSRHELDLRDGFSVSNHATYLAAKLNIPDSVVHSSTGRFIGVSNHYGKCVHIYEKSPALNVTSLPSGTLVGHGYPHGLRFSEDEKFVFLADAAEPFVHVYFDKTKNWRGEHLPVAAIRVMDDATFIRGRVNPEEGGPKGIALSHDNHVLAVTCEEEPLSFYDMRPIIAAKKFEPFVKPTFPNVLTFKKVPRKSFFARMRSFYKKQLKLLFKLH